MSNEHGPRVRVLPVQFRRPGDVGDFVWMRDQPEHARTLFVFNDNETEFLEHLEHGLGRPGAEGARSGRIGAEGRCYPGGGNAVTRPWQHLDPPRSAGVPTGESGGYPSLSERAREVIERAFAQIEALLATGAYDTVVYSADADGRLGTAIFSPADEVVDYITARLRALAER